MGAYKYMKDAMVVAVADPIPNRAKIFASKHKIDKIFTNHMDLLEIKDLDFVDVCTPTLTHGSIVCDVAGSGHDILLEKPMARSTAECEKMIAESKRHGVKLCVCHDQRFFSSVIQAKLMVDQGYYDILSVRTSCKGKLSQMPQWIATSQAGGLLWEDGYHSAYLQLFFLQNVKEVYARGDKLKWPVYDNFTVLLRTARHSFGIIEYNSYSKEREKLIEINGFNGNRAQVDLESDFLEDMSEPVYGRFLDIKRLLQRRKQWALRLLSAIFGMPHPSSHFSLISSFMDSLRRNSAPPVQPEEGKKTVRLLECIEESLNNRRPVLVSNRSTHDT